MAYNTGTLLNDIHARLQFHPRFDRDMRLAGLNRAIEKTILYASENYDVWTAQNPLDPNDPSLYATEFPLPDHLLYLASISFDARPLRRLTEAEWVNTRPQVSPDRRNPTSYYIRANRYVDLYPRPDKQATVEVFGLFKPDDVVNDLDPIPLDRQYSDALVSYACWWCTSGLPDAEEVQRSANFFNLYERQRAEAKFNLLANTEHRVIRTH